MLLLGCGNSGDKYLLSNEDLPKGFVEGEFFSVCKDRFSKLLTQYKEKSKEIKDTLNSGNDEERVSRAIGVQYIDTESLTQRKKNAVYTQCEKDVKEERIKRDKKKNIDAWNW